MIKYNLFNSMIGNHYPFFLGNNKLMEDANYYLYRVISPSLSEDLVPYISMEKISEKTRTNEPNGNGVDVITACLVNNKEKEVSTEKVINFLKGILWKDNPIIDGNGSKFPLIEMENGNNIQKSIVIGLRDSLRKKYYKYHKGAYIDILWTPTTYVVFKIYIASASGKEDKASIKPVAIYKNTDVEMKNPLPESLLDTIDYPHESWDIHGKTMSDFNQAIKKLEWASFNRKEFEY